MRQPLRLAVILIALLAQTDRAPAMEECIDCGDGGGGGGGGSYCGDYACTYPETCSSCSADCGACPPPPPPPTWCPERRDYSGYSGIPDATNCTNPTGAGTSYYAGADCTSEEYVTARYFDFSQWKWMPEGKPWDAGGTIGLTTLTVEVRSYRTTSGQCVGEAYPRSMQLGAQRVYRDNGSCSGYCGGRAPVGCSCDGSCELHGTCCSDYLAVCNPPATPGRGKAVIASTTAGRGGRDNQGEQRHGVSFLAASAYPSRVAAGLSKVSFADIDSNGEHSQCDIQANGAAWYLGAWSDYDDNKSACGAVALVGQSADYDGMAGAEGRAFWNAGFFGWPDGDGNTCLGGTYEDTPVLTKVGFEDVDDGSEWVWCNLAWVGGTCGWQLQAHAEDDAEARCKARLVSMKNGMTRLRTYTAWMETSQDNTAAQGMHYGTPPANGKVWSEQRVPMAGDAGAICYLSQVKFKDVDDGSERATCEIISENGRWTLVARGNGWVSDTDIDVTCSATCLSMPSVPGAPRYSWPPPPTVFLDSSSWKTGARALLFQNGAYDKPVVFAEGFDPTNRLGPSSYLTRAAPLFQDMFNLGYDVWMVDFGDGGAEITEIARELAEVIDHAAREHDLAFAATGKKIPVLGVSMGGIGGRVAMASWEQGKYNAGPEYIDGLTSRTAVPVSTLISLVGPQLGANIPKSIQLAVQDLGELQDLGEMTKALNSALAVNLLDERIDPRCDGVVSQWCDGSWAADMINSIMGGHGDFTLRNGERNITGFECPLDTTGCMSYDAAGWQRCFGFFCQPSTCQGYARTRDMIMPDINSRGSRGNGYAQTVTNIGIATGSFSRQGDDTMDEKLCQWNQQPFTGCGSTGCSPCASTLCPDTGAYGTEFALASFRDSGHGALGGLGMPIDALLGLPACSRNARIHLLMSRGANGSPLYGDLPGGDLSERGLSDAMQGGIADMSPTVTIGMTQHMPFLFVPTWSALHCPNSTDESSCWADNRAGGRFRRVHAAPLNNFHGKVDDRQGALIEAYLEDATSADGDGYIGQGNLIYQALRARYGAAIDPWFQPFDGNDGDGSVYPNAPELCDTKDNDGDGLIDEDSCAPPQSTPAVWFKFDETSGTPVNSGTLGSLGQTYSAYQQGVAGKNGGAIRFSATTHAVTLPDSPAVDGYANLTMEGWINFDSVSLPTAYATLGKKNYSYICRVYYSGGYGISNIIWNTAVQGNSGTIAAPAVGTWYHLACTWDGSAKRMKVYWNGALVASKTLTTGNATLADGTSPLTIGGSGGGENLVGKVDDFKLWNLTRSDADICASAGRTWNGTACY